METMGAVNKCHSAVLTNHWTSGTWCHRGSAAAQRWSPSPPVLPLNQAFESPQPLPQKKKKIVSVKGVGGQQTVGCVCVCVCAVRHAQHLSPLQPRQSDWLRLCCLIKKEQCVRLQGSNRHHVEHSKTSTLHLCEVVSVCSSRLLYCQLTTYVTYIFWLYQALWEALRSALQVKVAIQRIEMLLLLSSIVERCRAQDNRVKKCSKV